MLGRSVAEHSNQLAPFSAWVFMIFTRLSLFMCAGTSLYGSGSAFAFALAHWSAYLRPLACGL